MCSMNTRKSIFFSQTSVRIQLYKQLGYNTYLKLLKLKTTVILHNLSYVVLFFVICFTDGIFDAFNCWNHCIF